MTNRIIAPSLLAANFAALGDAVRTMERSGADWLHYDVMDAAFVPPLTFGAGVLAALRPLTDLFLDVHVMAERPYRLIDDLMDAGANGITFHVETVEDIPALIGRIRERGVQVGITLNPGTPVEALEPYLSLVDMVLIMTVNPGYGGQKMIPACLDKVRWVRERCPELPIQVDGGINRQTVTQAYAAGANVIVAGSAVFSAADPAAEIAALREA